MKKPAFLTLSALMLSACVGTGIETTADEIVHSKASAGCHGMTAISAAHAQSVNGLPFRCGPQSQLPVTYQ